MTWSRFRRLASTGMVGRKPPNLPDFTSSIGAGAGGATLVVATTIEELADIEKEHLARLTNADGGIVSHAVVKLVHRSVTGSAIVLQPTEKLVGITVTVEVDMNSRWPYAVPRRGGDIPGTKPLAALRPIAVQTTGGARGRTANPLAPKRPQREPAAPLPQTTLKLANDIYPDRLPLTAFSATVSEWQNWQLATAIVAEKAIQHRWSLWLRLANQPALEQPYQVVAPLGGRYSVAANLQVGDTLEAGQLLGTIAIENQMAEQVQSVASATGEERRRRIDRLRMSGIGDDLLVDLLLREDEREIPVFAPIFGVVEACPKDAEVVVGQSLLAVKVPAHTMAYGRLPDSQPLPSRVSLSLGVGTGRYSLNGLPLVERSHLRRSFAIPVPIIASYPGAFADMVNEQPSGRAAALPKDCVMSVARSREVLLHSGNRELIRKPVKVLYEDTECAYIDLKQLPPGAGAIRDLATVAVEFPKIAAIMVGFIMPKGA